MKKALFIASLGLLLNAVPQEGTLLYAKFYAEQVAFSESMILNSYVFNLRSAIQQGLLDRASPEYRLLA